MPNTNERDALTNIANFPITDPANMEAVNMQKIALAATAPNADVPMGAIVNGRTYIERIEQEGFECEAGNISMCTDWQELRRCFDTLADWAMHTAPNAAAPMADGFVLVPVEPTREMLDAYVNTSGRFHSARSDWSAMLAAAPAQQAGAPLPALSDAACDAIRAAVNKAMDGICEGSDKDDWAQCVARSRDGIRSAYSAYTGAPLPLAPSVQAEIAHEGMTIAGDGAAMLGKLMREQYASRGGVYPDGNPNASAAQALPLAPSEAPPTLSGEVWDSNPDGIVPGQDRGPRMNPSTGFFED